MPLCAVEGISVDNTFDDNDGNFEGEDLTTIISKKEFPIALEESSFIPYYYDPISMEADDEE